MVDTKHKQLSVRRQSVLLNINRSMLYYESSTIEDFELVNLITEIYAKYPIYGYRRITAILRNEGYVVNHKKVQRLMRDIGIIAIYPRPNTSAKAAQGQVCPYLLRDIEIIKPNQAWQTDITYLRMQSGFMYLVAIIDVYSRYIVGYKLSNNLCVDSCLEALEDAMIEHGRPEILNTDQGSQFTSNEWIETLSNAAIRISMTGQGRCCDNAHIERLWRSFKYEGVYLYQWRSVAELKANIGEWVYWYNYQRPHQSLKYQTPGACYGYIKQLKRAAQTGLLKAYSPLSIVENNEVVL